MTRALFTRMSTLPNSSWALRIRPYAWLSSMTSQTAAVSLYPLDEPREPVLLSGHDDDRRRLPHERLSGSLADTARGARHNRHLPV
jgi:hypothetical protein